MKVIKGHFLFILILALLVSLFSSFVLAAQAESQSHDIVFPILSPKFASDYGTRKHPVLKSVRHHNGIDLSVPKGTQVRAVAAGQIIFAGRYKGYGNLVTILHDTGHTSLYGHLDSIILNIGEIVKAGQILGRVGSTGLATGPHLHFEWRKNGKPINPETVFPYLNAKPEG